MCGRVSYNRLEADIGAIGSTKEDKLGNARGCGIDPAGNMDYLPGVRIDIRDRSCLVEMR